jgi:hypothetical protein
MAEASSNIGHHWTRIDHFDIGSAIDFWAWPATVFSLVLPMINVGFSQPQVPKDGTMDLIACLDAMKTILGCVS